MLILIYLFGFIYFYVGCLCGIYDEDNMLMKWLDDELCFICLWSYNFIE